MKEPKFIIYDISPKKKIIRSEALTKIYDPKGVPVKALDGVSLTLEAGEFTAIVGPSGCGKTSLLNLIGGLDQPNSGKIWIAGKEITQLKEKKLSQFRLHHIGLVFQAHNLVPVLTVWENIALTMQLQGRPKAEIKERVDELLQQIQLEKYAKRKPHELSGGQQQRVAIARALAPKPHFVLADEPSSSLDSQNTTHLLDLMYELNQKEKTTFLFSTHDELVMRRAKRVIYLEDGKIVKDESRSL